MMSDATAGTETGTGLSTEYSERVGDIGPNVRQLNIEEQREELAETITAIRRKVNASTAFVAAGAIAAAVLAIVVSVKSARKHREADARLKANRGRWVYRVEEH